jgi:hypothetical protein
VLVQQWSSSRLSSVSASWASSNVVKTQKLPFSSADGNPAQVICVMMMIRGRRAWGRDGEKQSARLVFTAARGPGIRGRACTRPRRSARAHAQPSRGLGPGGQGQGDLDRASRSHACRARRAVETELPTGRTLFELEGSVTRAVLFYCYDHAACTLRAVYRAQCATALPPAPNIKRALPADEKIAEAPF